MNKKIMPFHQFFDCQYSIVFKQRIRPNKKKTKNLLLTYYNNQEKKSNGKFDLKGHKENIQKGDNKNNVIMT